MKDDAPELWINSQESTMALRVKIKLEDVRLTEEEGMLKRTYLKKDPRVREMRILKLPFNTNYKLDPIHAQHIRKLWEQRKK